MLVAFPDGIVDVVSFHLFRQTINFLSQSDARTEHVLLVGIMLIAGEHDGWVSTGSRARSSVWVLRERVCALAFACASFGAHWAEVFGGSVTVRSSESLWL